MAVIKIENVVASTSLGEELDLQAIVTRELSLLGTCASSVCDPAQVCDDSGNVSFGDNIAPGPGPC